MAFPRGGSGAVSSVFTRTGAVVAQSGDYNATEVPNVVVLVAQSATPAIDTDNGTYFSITGLAQAITSLTTNLTGTPVHGQEITIEYTDNGTAQTITRGAKFTAPGLTFPTGTTANTILREHYTYNVATSTWDLLWATVDTDSGGSLSNNGATLSSNVSFAVSATTTIITTASLAVGTWLLSFVGSISVSGNGGCDVYFEENTAVATFLGAPGGQNSLNAAAIVPVSIHCIAVVTTAGTMNVVVTTDSAAYGSFLEFGAQAPTVPVTGYTAVKIA